MKLTRSDLWSLEEYASRRQAFRAEVIAHKKLRNIALGPHATLYFEDRLTMHYQIQEMLRVERIFEAAEIEEELDSYNPLIPDGSNWKATFMIEYGDAEERTVALANMGGIEQTVWVRVGESGEKVFAYTNEDMERTRDEKAAAVHFMRFELGEGDVASLKSGDPLFMGIDHGSLPGTYEVTADQRTALIADLA
ncbi:MAG TPA: DUF3501 domain-containing protein [Gammaproteobacteria bacterium]|nr:DUF3501 domain-containing protein [Gammaproteobacteria bacterium]|tara:strand:- start:8302 stop:8883 length:582 start_codon:yes stop_codon:yes gene_type:complete